jgi:NAD(P)-dependent dehydrogenase (short-subunit alcohol dehydrogenase family)
LALVLVTGASTGLGLATALELADHGHDVVLHARRRDRLDGVGAAADRVRGVVLGDLAEHEEVSDVADQANSFGRFDAVVHNAGTMDGPDVVAVNVLAPYQLTASMPLPARAIFLSSSMHLSGRPDVHLVDGRGGTYSDSKLLVTTFALALAARRPTVLSHAVDPGWVPTRMGGASAPDDLAEGHRTQAWLATAPETELSPRTGGYWHHRAAIRPHPAALDDAFQQELLDALAARTGRALPAPISEARGATSQTSEPTRRRGA